MEKPFICYEDDKRIVYMRIVKRNKKQTKMKKALNTLKALFLKIKAHQKDFWSVKGKSGFINSSNLW